MSRTLALVLAGLWLFNLARLIATGLSGDAPESGGAVPGPAPIVAAAEPVAIERAAPADGAMAAPEAAGADSIARPNPLALEVAVPATSDPE